MCRCGLVQLCTALSVIICCAARQVPPASPAGAGQRSARGARTLCSPTSLEQLRPKLSLPKMKYTTPPPAHRHPLGGSLFLRLVLRGTVFALRGTVLRGTCLEGHCQLGSLRAACPGGGRAAARLRAGATLLRHCGERGGRWGGELRAARALEVQPRAGLEVERRAPLTLRLLLAVTRFVHDAARLVALALTPHL